MCIRDSRSRPSCSSTICMSAGARPRNRRDPPSAASRGAAPSAEAARAATTAGIAGGGSG
eukprot:14184602-Alexandrium_andersonii.AAC.1